MTWTVAGTDPSGATIMQNEFGETQLVAAQAAPDAMAPFMGAEQFPAVPEPELAQPPMLADSGNMAPSEEPLMWHEDTRGGPVGFGVQNLPDPSLKENAANAVFARPNQTQAMQDPSQARTGTPAYIPPDENSMITAGKSLEAAERMTRMLNGPRGRGAGGGGAIRRAEMRLGQAGADRLREEDEAALAKADYMQSDADRSQEIGKGAVSRTSDLLAQRKEAEEEEETRWGAIEKTRKDLRERDNELAQRDLDPNRVINTAPKKFMAIFARILGAAAANLRGDMRNLAGEQIDQAITRDIDAQKYNIEKERRHIQDQLGVTSEEAKELVTESSMKAAEHYKQLGVRMQELEALRKVTTNEQVGRNIDSLYEELDARRALAAEQAAAINLEQMKKARARRAAFQRKQLLKEREYQDQRRDKAREFSFEERKLAAKEGGGGSDVVDIPNVGRVNLAGLGEGEKKDARQAAGALIAFENQLDALENRIKENDGSVAKHFEFTETHQLAKAEADLMAVKLARANETGVLTDADLARYKKQIADATSARTGLQLNKVKQLRQMLRRDISGKLQAYGAHTVQNTPAAATFKKAGQ